MLGDTPRNSAAIPPPVISLRLPLTLEPVPSHFKGLRTNYIK